MSVIQNSPLNSASSSLNTHIHTDTTPHLRHIASFYHFLSNYKISPAARDILQHTPLVLLTSVTSAGRNTIINELIKTGDYRYIPSDTTRPRRLNSGVWEQDGVEYFFRNETEVLDDLKAGNYIGPAIIHGQQVSGMNINQIRHAHADGKIPITDIEIVGAIDVLADAPHAMIIFPLPPNFEEWLKRIHKRSKFSKIEFYRRLATAANEFTTALNKKSDITFVVNDHLPDTVKIVDAIAKGKHEADTEAHAREVAKELLKCTQKYIAQNFSEFTQTGTLDA